MKIRIDGCDDSTEFEIEIDPPDEDLIRHIAEISERTSKNSCQPVLVVVEDE